MRKVGPYIFKDPNDPTRTRGLKWILPNCWSRNSAGRSSSEQYAFPSLVSGLQRGDFDFAMNGLEVTPDRRNAIRFSRPYYVYTLQLVVRADEQRFRTLADCTAVGGVVGTMEDTAAERLLEEQGVEKKIYDSQVEPYFDLELGRMDAVLLDCPSQCTTRGRIPS